MATETAGGSPEQNLLLSFLFLSAARERRAGGFPCPVAADGAGVGPLAGVRARPRLSSPPSSGLAAGAPAKAPRAAVRRFLPREYRCRCRSLPAARNRAYGDGAPRARRCHGRLSERSRPQRPRSTSTALPRPVSRSAADPPRIKRYLRLGLGFRHGLIRSFPI
jgi:hypothetical protein